ncbi:carbohydrate-binding module family 1 protein [Peniophora sp. CONT]|nr:carbohydrate-binding module family 1 protein [Peniophora sp. CONT]
MKCIATLLALVATALAVPAPTSRTVGDKPSGTLTARAAAGSCSGTKTPFTYFGVNESGAEFGSAIPGTLGTDYTFPSPSSVDYFMNLGFNTFRVPFLMERLAPPSTGLTGTFDSTYLSGITTFVEHITSKGGFAILDPHNFMIYNGAQITSTSNFKSFWTNLATKFAGNANVIFDLMNEPHDIAASTVVSLMQAGIDGIRAAGAKQLILAEGTSYTGAWTWTTTSGNAAAFEAAPLNDPLGNTAIEMHQYLDSDGSGTSDQCVSSTIGAERVAAATAWLQKNNLKGFLGEIGAGNNDACIEAVYGAFCAMQQAGGVWVGATWWSAGPWWGSYIYSMEPSTGVAVASMLPEALEPFLPVADGTVASSSSAAPAATSTAKATSTSAAAVTNVVTSVVTSSSAAPVVTTAAAITSAAASSAVATSTEDESCPADFSTSAVVVTSSSVPVTSSAAAVATSVPSVSTSSVRPSSSSTVPTTTSVAPTTVAATSSSAAAVSTATSSVGQYYQCGGVGYTGATTCASPYTCVAQNDYYSQCLYVSASSGASPATNIALPSVSVNGTSTAPAATSTASGTVAQYYQCGGSNWTGPTECEAGYTCVVQNLPVNNARRGLSRFDVWKGFGLFGVEAESSRVSGFVLISSH